VAPPRHGGDRALRVPQWKRQVALSLVAISAGIVLMLAIVALGHAHPVAVAIWAPLSMAASAFAYLALHRGWSLGWKDPSVTEPQIVFSGCSVVACYAMAGPMRAAVLPMMCVAMIYAIFALPARHVRWIATGLLALLGTVMIVMSQWQPTRYPAGEELATFFAMTIVLPVFAVLAGRLSELRERLRRQTMALREALQRNVELAERDALTGLLNRRRATEMLDHHASQASRGGTFAVALLDIDHFKRINDGHGHVAGDVVLQRFAAAAQAMLREGDLLARWGGEEFLLLLPAATADAALALARRVREGTAALTVPVPSGAALAFTVSVGVAALRAGESATSVLERADAALYLAKAGGRNRVEAA
jgi:diguanylate cyclase (GGDEF)-like protein